MRALRITLPITLLISVVALTGFVIPLTSASAEAPTLPRLRAHLRHVRTHLRRAQATLKSVRADRDQVRAIVALAGGLPVVAPADAAAPTPTPSPDVAPHPTDVTAPTTDIAGDGAATPPDLGALLAALRPALAADLLADGAITADEVTALETAVVKWQRVVRRLRRAERSLKARIALRRQIAEWNRNGAWRPLIKIAAARRGISARGLYRLMMAESGGRRYAGSLYKGLFQYYPGTWRARWNPWRGESIYNGWAQIQATAYAIDRGMGPANWPRTYPAAF